MICAKLSWAVHFLKHFVMNGTHGVWYQPLYIGAMYFVIWHVIGINPYRKWDDNSDSSKECAPFHLLDIIPVSEKPWEYCQTSILSSVHATHSKSLYMMTSSNGNIFLVTGPLCGEFTGPGKFPTQRPVTRSFDVYFDLPLNKRLGKQPWGWWFETLSWSLWRHRNESSPIPIPMFTSGGGHTFRITW